MKKLGFFCSITLFFLCAISTAFAKEIIWESNGFSQPESVTFNPVTQQFIVSNINSGPLDKDGNGFLSLLDIHGKVIERQWVSGFDAPTGATISGGKLYVPDINVVRVVDLAQHKIVKTIEVSDSSYLNDATSDNDGNVYVSDILGNAIFRIHDGHPEQWIKDEKLHHPNGLFVKDGKILVASWGDGLHKDFSTDIPGSLLTISLKDKSLSVVNGGKNIGNLDGVVSDNSAIYLTDNTAGKVIKLDYKGNRHILASLTPGCADITLANGMIIIPQLSHGLILAIPKQ
jgi:streptogramin lyase